MTSQVRKTIWLKVVSVGKGMLWFSIGCWLLVIVMASLPWFCEPLDNFLSTTTLGIVLSWFVVYLLFAQIPITALGVFLWILGDWKLEVNERNEDRLA